MAWLVLGFIVAATGKGAVNRRLGKTTGQWFGWLPTRDNWLPGLDSLTVQPIRPMQH